MLQQRYRLRRSDDVDRVWQQGRSWRHPLAVLLVNPNAKDVSRFAFVASRRVGKAVDRNRAKRLLREAVRPHLSEIKSGWDCLFVARKTTPEASLATVESAVSQLLARADLLVVQPSSRTRPEIDK